MPDYAQMKRALAALFFLTAAISIFGADTGRKILHGHTIPITGKLTPLGRPAATNELSLAIGLPLRHEADLDVFISQLYNPSSTNYHKFIGPAEFAARFGPTADDYATVKKFAAEHGLKVTQTYANRLVLDVQGRVGDFERAFQIQLHTYRHPEEARNFFAPDSEPSVPVTLPVADMMGLSDYSRPRPLLHAVPQAKISPLNYNGSGPGGSYRGSDFRNAYVPNSPLTGGGQVVAVFEEDTYYQADITNYEASCGYTNVPLQNVWVNISSNSAPGYSGVANAVAEVSLDIELAIAMAPGLSKLMVYQGNNPYDVFNQITSDNIAKQISSSWTFGTGPAHNWHQNGTTLDSIFKNMVAQGQSLFQASGDSDAYTGSQSISSSTGPIPVDSPYLTSVGGTTLTMTGGGAAWSSETVWNWGNNNGSGGGVSSNYPIPYWQTNASMTANNGSTANRNFPDVALTADANYVVYNNGQTGYFGGTSCAAPLWAGFTALANQQSFAGGGTNLGFLNPVFYAIASASCYTNCFNDITTGNNIGSHTSGLYYAVTNYDLATGLGTPAGTNLINALIAPPPVFLSQPAGRNITNGANITLTASASSSTSMSYFWQCNGTNLFDGGNISGSATNTLSLTGVNTNNSGSYQLVASNATGFVSSRAAVLNVGFAPTVSVSPSSQMVFAGNNAVFTAMPGGSSPFSYQWKRGGTNFGGANITGTNGTTLTISSAVTNNSGNYTVVVANLFGSVTSSVAALTVVLPPSITSSTITNRSGQCGQNTNIFSLTVIGTAPLSYQWSTNGVPVSGATGTSFGLTNLHLAGAAISVTITNLYGSVTTNAVITVSDSLTPIITLNGASRVTNELGSAFNDPGATANDLCAGAISVSVSGNVNIAAVGTNTLTYTANDGNGNIATTNRVVIVRDTTPPAISRSFTNLIIAANSNCVALMPNVTGTNFILATDLSGAVTTTQSPTNNATLSLGTNVIVLTAADPSGNKAYSTNRVIVQDQTPPLIFGQPQSQTNFVGGTVSFTTAATACTPLAYHWFFNNTALPAQTNSTLTLSNLKLISTGNYFAIATAAGGSATSAVATLTLNLNPATLALVASANPDGFKDILNFTAAVTPTNASGTIQFLTNGTAFDLEPLSTGTATSTNLSTLPRGTNLITAIYSGDAIYLPATNSLAQIVTNHPPQVLPAYYTLVAGQHLSLAVADLATNWSDADGDPLTLVTIGTSTNGVTVTNTTPFLFYANPNYVNDQFVCIISDGLGGTNFQSVNITILPQTNSTPLITVAPPPPASGVTLQLNGAYNATYILESATDLTVGHWQPVATNTLGLAGTWQFTDFGVTNNPSRFYRLELVP